MAQVTLVELIVMQKLDEINIIIQLKGQNRQNTFKATSTTVSNGPSFQMLQKNAKTRKNRSIKYCSMKNLS